MKRRWLISVVAFMFAACSSSLVAEPVQIAVRTDVYTPWCHTFATIGTLVPNAETGTAIVEDRDSGGNTVPVRWPAGFSARRVGGVIEVLNQDGLVVARTGGHYRFNGGYGEGGWRGCDGVIPEPTSTPANPISRDTWMRQAAQMPFQTAQQRRLKST